MKNIVLKINELKDLDEILVVANKVFKPNLQEKEKYHNKTNWLEKLKNGFLISVVVDNIIVGFAISYKKKGCLHIWNVGVLKDYRKMGIWKRMYEEIIEYAKKHNFQKISLNTYKEKFPKMYNFCKNEGFVENKTERDSLSGYTKSMFSKKLES
jgi:ribosomal protein S18 acetylase RimI-like enzyme